MNTHTIVPTSIMTPIALTCLWKSKWKSSSWSHLAKQVDIWVLSCSTYSSRGVLKFHFKIYRKTFPKRENNQIQTNFSISAQLCQTASVRRQLTAEINGSKIWPMKTVACFKVYFTALFPCNVLITKSCFALHPNCENLVIIMCTKRLLLSQKVM